ncbi:MAG: type IV pilus modification protein PilV [Ottowia sp.]|uniref:type IV pilus modification protein PilV n=1 Tax=unclassified Ottowia TaxID=2645081 RepID=UPI003C2DCB5D
MARRRYSQRGITLLESLVAIVVVALGILGIIAVQMRTLTDTQTAVRRAQAVRLIEDFSERMKVNPNALLNMSAYTSGYAKKMTDYEGADCLGATCTPAELAKFDLLQWKTTVQETLPGGQASIFLAPGETEDTNRRQIGVIIAWRENERAGTKTDEIDASKVQQADGSFAGGTDEGNACPAGFTCHLQYLPVSARCAPYGGSGVQTVHCL